MTTFFLCPGMPSQAIRARFEEAAGTPLVYITPAGFSRVFRQESYKYLRDGRILPNLLAARGSGTRASFISFSAGYGFLDELLKIPDDVQMIDAIVLLDSLHSGKDPDGTASDRQIAKWTSFAERAHAGKALLWVAHTDVPTPYASTTDTAHEVLSLAGLDRATEPWVEGELVEYDGGGLHVRSYNKFPRSRPKAEHSAALSGWGPDYVREAFQELPKPVNKYDGMGRGEAAVAAAVGELGKTEVPYGSNTSSRIIEYFSHATRGGKPLRLRAGNWCAVFACFCMRASGPDVHPYRVSGIEMQRDAQALDIWEPAHKGYVPAVGDVAIWQRGTKGSWKRHVGRVEKPPTDDEFQTIDGNKNNSVRRWTYKLSDEKLLGFVRYPVSQALASPTYSQLWELKRKIDQSVDGMDEVQRLVDQLLLSDTESDSQ